MKIVVVNGSPRPNWNTATLLKEAAEGAKSQGAEVVYFDLYRQEKFTGCISCFGCKLPANEGRCIVKDGLTPILSAIREADGLILGTPNYFGDITAGTRALYERLLFPYLTYKISPRSCNPKAIPVLLVMTSNAPNAFYETSPYGEMLKNYQRALSAFIGNTKVFVVGDTLQVKDYSRYNWTMFDPEKKKLHHETTFPAERTQAFALGAEMVQKPW